MSRFSSVQNSELQPSEIVRRLVDNNGSKYGNGTMTCAAYDTAWVSLVRDPKNPEQWLFPECFAYILKTQEKAGGWQSHASDLDGIMNTLGALYALTQHRKHAAGLSNSVEDIQSRIDRAIAYLQKKLQTWNVAATVHVGFEYLIPNLLDLIAAEGIHFEFPARKSLMAINQKKMAKFHPSFLYGPVALTALHSLEAFVGKIDFDKVKHHLTNGSMMASPSSTAAYLMYSSVWDGEAEEYLRDVVKHGEGKGSGGIPSAFPSNIFEISWVISTLLEAGFTKESLGSELDAAIAFLEDVFEKQNGLVGFVPGVGSDADDTAKVITSLNLLGKHVLPTALIETYETDTHFKTYAMERDPSFSANCNVLNALLHVEHPENYIPQIQKCVSFLCDKWWKSGSQIEDKWNLSDLYPTMLMSQSFVILLKQWSQGGLKDLPADLVTERIPSALLQALVQLLHSQKPTGAWGSGTSSEETAYGLLTIAHIASLEFVSSLWVQIEAAIESGRRFLLEKGGKTTQAEHLWVEKVTYASISLSDTYIIAALSLSSPQRQLGTSAKGLITIPTQKIAKFSQFFRQLPLYKNTSPWKVQAALMEGYLFLPQLKRVRLDIFPRKGMDEDKYFEYIPFTWTGANNRVGTFLPSEFLYEMMVISFLNYQADEYMEAVVGGQFADRLDDVREIIARVFKEASPALEGGVPTPPASETIEKTSNTSPSLAPEPGPSTPVLEPTEPIIGSEGGESQLASATQVEVTAPTSEIQDSSVPNIYNVYQTLKSFVEYVLFHPKVVKSSPYDQLQVRNELQIFLLAHVTQIEDNLKLAAAGQGQKPSFSSPSFYNWVRTTSADHTSCPYSFALISCLLSKGDGSDCFSTAEEKYIANDMCRHLATLCRIYNDYGSLLRDRAEQNVNSMDFPEFAASGTASDDDRIKAQLWQISEHERAFLDMSLQFLGKVSQKNGKQKLFNAISMFCDVTNTYGEIYVVRDIASRMTKN